MTNHLLLTAVCLCSSPVLLLAQNQTTQTKKFEITVLVVEAGTNAPVEEAAIKIVKEPDAGQAFPDGDDGMTNTLGTFDYTPSQSGRYFIAAFKKGWTSPSVSNSVTVELAVDHPQEKVRLILARPGELSGMAVDDDGKVLPDLPVRAIQLRFSMGRRVASAAGQAITDGEGRFSIGELVPGEYGILIEPLVHGDHKLMLRYTEDERKGVDQDYAKTYIPGGPDVDSVLPVPVYPGSTSNVGTLRAPHKSTFYRVHVSLGGDCSPDQKVEVDTYSANGLGASSEELGQVACSTDFLMKNYQPGSYWLDIRTLTTSGAERRRALVPFEVRDKNLELTANLALGREIRGKMVIEEGTSRAPDKIRFMMIPLGISGIASDFQPATPNKDGVFEFVGRQPGRQQLSVLDLPPGYYVKTVKYKGIAVRNNIFSWEGDGLVEVEIGDHPSVISGTVNDADGPVIGSKIYLITWPPFTDDISRSVQSVTTDKNGKFEYRGTMSGNYRLFAVPSEAQSKVDEPNTLARLLGRAMSITVEANSNQSLDVKISNPDQ